MYIKLMRCLLFMSLAVIMLCGCDGNTGQEALRVGVRSDVINFGYFNESTGKYYGMEIDLAQELAQRLGFNKVEFVPVDPYDREQKLENGEIDCLIACYTITPERQERFDISSPYYIDSTVIMVENSSMIDDVKQLLGKKIGVMENSSTAREITAALFEQGIVTDYTEDSFHVAEYSGGVTFCEMASYDELIAALEEGSIDAVSTDECILQQYKTEEQSYVDIDISEHLYGVASNKDSALTNSVEDAVQGICTDGSMKILIDKWE
ncbi:MAG: transporter substrate-binding domain-containing protein [Lachnospiraceae bacterium]|nr:transporter substrate-binding domain-containing protein [Lachnospiraceae bacterium]